MLQSHNHLKPRFPSSSLAGQQSATSPASSEANCSMMADFQGHGYPSTSVSLPSTSEPESSNATNEIPLSIKISPPESPISSSPTFDHSNL
ncbi:Hypothetical protein NTJ_06456 [Nesidiocoris tenuis]|uniref:Uncharacterized protein n=1 Tax=Nesidiocoris tenuis TaxID=355587 RepID=A0ABN7AQN7_9HEMI|nr:Hypothetical protein NTJ_06456 [Nesidiocoris tenuis]